MIMYLKSSLSISSYFGCIINCKYCILSTYRENNIISKNCDEKELCDRLLKNKYFVKNFTPITINNVSDPFLNKTLKKSTFKILDILEKEKINNPLILITKGYLNDQDILKLSSYKSNIHIFYTYSGLSELMENRNKKNQIETILKLFKLKNIKLVHYWRPIIEGVNSSERSIKQVIKEVGKYFKIVIVSGIRINTHLLEVFKKNQIPINITPNSEHKIINEDTYNRVKNLILKYNPETSVFKKTSCAVSYLNNLQDYNGYSYDDNICTKDCHNIEICTKGKDIIITKKHFLKLLNNISKSCDFKICKKIIEVDCDLTQEEISYLKHNTRKKIKANKIIKSNNEEILSL